MNLKHIYQCIEKWNHSLPCFRPRKSGGVNFLMAMPHVNRNDFTFPLILTNKWNEWNRMNRSIEIRQLREENSAF